MKGRESDSLRSWGTVLLSLGLLFVALLVATGLHALSFDQPDMLHLNQAVMTVVLGPIAVIMVTCGLILRRRS